MKEENKNERMNIEEYSNIGTKDVQEYIKENNISLNGMSNSEAIRKIQEHGYNELKQAKPKKWYYYFMKSLLTPFNCILLGIAVVLSYTDIIIAVEPSYANIIVIICLVLISTLLEFFEEYRSNKAAEKLKELVATTTTVLRQGNKEKVQLNEVAIGDIVLLSDGDM